MEYSITYANGQSYGGFDTEEAVRADLQRRHPEAVFGSWEHCILSNERSRMSLRMLVWEDEDSATDPYGRPMAEVIRSD
jgi:hypothetical protein